MAKGKIEPVNPATTYLVRPETGDPFRLYPAEKLFLAHMFTTDSDGQLVYSDLLYCTGKKGGKTEFGAIMLLVTLLLFGGPHAEGFAIANDYDQAQQRVYKRCCDIIRASPLLKREAKVRKDRIVFAATGATITPLASDYASAAGGHPTISIFDEIWGFYTERGRRLWDELVPVPTRKVSCRMIVSHAGFEDQSQLLYELYQQGLKQPEVAPCLHAGDGMLMFWTHDPVSPLQTEKWRDNMRRKLRPAQYLRMIENRFVSGESSFVDRAAWERCVDPQFTGVVSAPALPVWVGVDASTKHDSTAVVAVTFDDKAQQVRLVTHRVFQPSADQPLDFETTVEATLLDLNKRFRLRKVLFDPWQMQAVAQRLKRAGLPIEEYPQSSANLTAASQGLYELIRGGNLVVYPDAAMRLAISRAVAIETPRGWKISKDKQSHKIDVVVALACRTAVQQPVVEEYMPHLGWRPITPAGEQSVGSPLFFSSGEVGGGPIERDYNERSSSNWRDFVEPSGLIRSTPRSSRFP
jgi:phage terminase large subunit-like protein